MRIWLSIVIGLLLWSAGEIQAVDKAKLRWARSNPKIDSIHIEGNESLSYSEIRKHLYSRTRGLWLSIKGDRRSRVQRETLGRDTLEIKYLYLTSGFLGVTIDHSYEIAPPDSSALVRIVINEGPQYCYGPVRLTGQSDPQYHPRVMNILNRLTPGLPINLFDLKDTEVAVRAFLANRGYPYAQVTYQIDTIGSPDRSPVTYEINSDSLVQFGGVTVQGARHYPQGVALRELKIRSGEMYRREDILESQRRLFESGYYTTFQIRQAEDTPDRLTPDFVLELRERKPTYLVARTGASKSEIKDLAWDVSFGIGSRNSFGLMGPRRIEALADYSFSAGHNARLFTHRYRLKFSQPWFLGIRMPFSLIYEWEPTIRNVKAEVFDRRSWSVKVAFLKWFGRQVRADFGLQYENVKISGIPADEIPTIKEEEGISARRKFYASIRRDSRDDLFIPTRGSVTEFSGQVYGGFLRGDADFFKLQGSWSRYRRVWPGWVSAIRVRGAWAEEYGQTQSVPLDETLSLGGASTVRGFEENRLGPLLVLPDDRIVPEARYTLVFNHEFRWKTVQFLNVLPFVGDIFKRFPQWQSIFVDVGNGFRNKEEMRFKNLAVSYGTGLQISSPAGPIRIDRAWVLEHHDFEYSDRWHFTILYAF